MCQKNTGERCRSKPQKRLPTKARGNTRFVRGYGSYGKQSVGDFFSWLHLSEFTLGGKQTSITVRVDYLFTFLLLYYIHLWK